MTPKDKTNTTGPLSDELVDKLLKGYSKPEDLISEGGILKQLTGRLIQPDATLNHHQRGLI